MALGQQACSSRCPIRFSAWSDRHTWPTQQSPTRQLLRPYPQYNGQSIAINPTNRNSIYHSAQVKVEKRFGRGGSSCSAPIPGRN